MKLKSFLLTVFIASIAGWISGTSAPLAPSAVAPETAYARVMRTQTLRCGYALWPNLVDKDPNGGKLSGIMVDYVEAMGNALNLKIEWAEEIGWGDFPTALNNGRIDAFCTGAWPTASRARQVDFVRPILYQPIYAYARADDHRFNETRNTINNPAVTVATMDGEMSGLIAAADFPNAKTLAIPQLSSVAQLLLNVADKKADLTFTDPESAAQFMAKNPGKIRRIEGAPLRLFGDPLVIARGQDELRRMLDTSTEELLNSGAIDNIVNRHEQHTGTFLRTALPYRVNP